MTLLQEYLSGVMTRQEKWDRHFLDMAKLVSSMSKDPSTQVGCVLVDENRVVVGQGYNGFPRGVEDSHERLHNRELKLQYVVHAEVNAIIQAGHRARGTVMYVYPPFGVPNTCADCAGAAIQAGIIGCVQYNADPERGRVKAWSASLGVAGTMWQEAGLWTRSYDE